MSDSVPFDPTRFWRSWWATLGLRAPLSGDVVQDIDAALVRSVGGQLGFVNITAPAAADPQLERRITEQVASYGRQLGRLMDAVDVLIRRLDRSGLDADDVQAVDQLTELRAEIEVVKARSASAQVDQLLAEVRALRRDPAGNGVAIARLRAELDEATV